MTWGNRIKRSRARSPMLASRARSSGVAIPPATFVAALYRGVLGREPDPLGMDHYRARLGREVHPDDVARAFAASDEAALRLLRSPALGSLCRLSWEASNLPSLPRRQLYFLHIMKTGGTTFGRFLKGLAGGLILSDIFLDQLVALPRPVIQRARLVAGHLGYEAREFLSPGAAVCTIVRHPVERTLSHYWHLRRDPAVMAEDPHFSLEVFLESPRWRALAANYQSRHLVHRIGLGGAWVEFAPPARFAALGPPFPASHELPLQSLFDSTPLQLTEEELVDAALARLDDIDFVGVTEHLDALIEPLVDFFEAQRRPCLGRENVGLGRPRMSELPAAVIERIRDMNVADLMLHEAARRRVVQEVQGRGRRMG